MIARSTGCRLLPVLALAFLLSSPALAQWRLQTLEGGWLALDDFQGSWVVLNYWATWCKPCREEMPDLDEMDRERKDVAVVGIAWEDTAPGELRKFLEQTSVGYPIVPVDPFDPPPGLEAPRVLPTSVVFDPEGDEVERLYGPVTRKLLEEVIAGGGQR